MRCLVLRWDAPLVSFGGVAVDQHGMTERFPGTSLLTGLLGNALGWQHTDQARLQDLQQRLVYGARWDCVPYMLVDYHTVDLGQPKMVKAGWTTRGEPEHRDGGASARTGTHQRYRHYWMDGLLTVVVALQGQGCPDIEDLAEGLRHPARPLFLGRKCCLPARPLLDPLHPLVDGASVTDVLRRVPVWDRRGRRDVGTPPTLEACWPVGEASGGHRRRVFEIRDWATQLPAGSRERMEGLLPEADA